MPLRLFSSLDKWAVLFVFLQKKTWRQEFECKYIIWLLFLGASRGAWRRETGGGGGGVGKMGAPEA